MKATTLQPEHAIAVRWLNYCERTGTTHRISDPATFRFHVAEAKEEGELRANCREINHAETVAIARERIASGKWPKALANFTTKASPAKAEKAKPVKVAEYKGNVSYRYGEWMIYITTRTSRDRRTGKSIKSTHWDAHIAGETPQIKHGFGGIREAVKDIDALKN